VAAAPRIDSNHLLDLKARMADALKPALRDEKPRRNAGVKQLYIATRGGARGARSGMM